MSFRNRPVLDRRHKPRWREERRTQQLLVGGFALAIAVTLGILGATEWNGYYDEHLRPVAVVAETSYTRDALGTTATILLIELDENARRLEQQGDPNDPTLQQQREFLAQQAAQVETTAVDRMVTAAFQRQLATSLGISVSPAEVEADIARRATTAAAVRLSIIALDAVPADAEPGTEPTDEDFTRAEERALELIASIRGGADFAALATAESTDESAAAGGDIGFVGASDARYADLFAATQGVAVGELAEPVRTPTGYTVVRVEERREEARDPNYLDRFEDNGVEADAYRRHVADGLLDDKFRLHFREQVAVSPQEQRHVAQIFIAEPAAESIGTERRVRHVLIAPLPDAPDQTAATDEQWAAALARAEGLRDELATPDADWSIIAASESADPQSGQRGGDLGWASVDAPPYVPEFAMAVQELAIGEVSEPVRSQFGYHIIQVTDERESAAAQIQSVLEEVRGDPEQFDDVARRVSEDFATASKGGDVGWVARYELDAVKEDAIFGLTEVGSVSEPVAVPGEGTYIYRLVETDPEREIEQPRLEQIRNGGYERWLAELRSQADIWIDPVYEAPATAPQP